MRTEKRTELLVPVLYPYHGSEHQGAAHLSAGATGDTPGEPPGLETASQEPWVLVCTRALLT